MMLMGLFVASLSGGLGVRAAVPGEMSPAAAAVKAEECVGLAAQMRDYKEARHQLMKGLIKKNDTMAETLDVFAGRFEEKKMSYVDQGDIASLKTSAEAFRSHAKRETHLISKFEASSERLFARVAHCLGSTQGKMAFQ